jgi:hypothetical protein
MDLDTRGYVEGREGTTTFIETERRKEGIASPYRAFNNHRWLEQCSA